MWDMQQSVLNSEQMQASGKDFVGKLVRSIPNIYYSDTPRPIIVDKCRSWTLPANLEMLNKYFDNPVKIIVLVRPVVEIVASFMALRKANGWTNLEAGLLDDGSEPIMRSLAGVEWARKNNTGQFLFVTYDELIDDTQASLCRIYQHCGWQPFEHNLQNIVNNHKENDAVYGLIGQHDIRSTISKRILDVKLSNKLVNKCIQLDVQALSQSVI